MSREEAYMAINGNTDVTLELRFPITILGFFKPTRPVNTVHLAVDEPERLLKRLRDLERFAA